ncbi:hypothetical protein GCM10027075_29570 [Streptomyces heilongjiangensis]
MPSGVPPGSLRNVVRGPKGSVRSPGAVVRGGSRRPESAVSGDGVELFPAAFDEPPDQGRAFPRERGEGSPAEPGAGTVYLRTSFCLAAGNPGRSSLLSTPLFVHRVSNSGRELAAA